VTISVADDRDIIDWIGGQLRRIGELRALPPVAGLLEAADDNDHDLISGPQSLGG